MKRIKTQAEQLLLDGLEILRTTNLRPEVFKYINEVVDLCQTILILEKEPK